MTRTHAFPASITPLGRPLGLACASLVALLGCSDERNGTKVGSAAELHSIGSVVQNPEGRTLLVQTLRSLDEDIDNSAALEFAGNSRHWAHGGAVYIGLAEEPTIEKYLPDEAGNLSLAGRVSFLSYGLANIPAGQLFLSDTKAYLFAEEQVQVIIWNPSAMEIEGEIDLSEFQRVGFDLELWMPSAAGDRVYVPLRYVNFDAGEILHQASVIQIDAGRDEVVGVAHDDRCVGAGEPTITEDGTAYVLADGRSYLAQVYAMAQMETPPTNCVLRILPGETSFDPNFYVEVPSFAGGRDVATSLWSVEGGVGFAKMYYPEHVAPGSDTSGFHFWFNPAFKLWRLQLGEEIRADEVEGAPFSMAAFSGVPMDGSLFIGETQDGVTSTLYEVHPDTNRAEARFVMQGVMRDIYRLR